MDFLAEIAESLPEEGDLARQVIEYIVGVDSVGLDEFRAALRNQGHNELEAIMGTIAETLLEQGEALGLSRGRLEGLAEGKAETLLRLARKRFGDVPGARADMVLSADVETLDRWLDALIGAGALDEVFEPR